MCCHKLANQKKLDSLTGVGGIVTRYFEGIVVTGSTAKSEDDQNGPPPPRTVLELTTIDRLAAETTRMLYQDFGVDSLAALCKALFDRQLDGVNGLGPKMKEIIRKACAS